MSKLLAINRIGGMIGITLVFLACQSYNLVGVGNLLVFGSCNNRIRLALMVMSVF